MKVHAMDLLKLVVVHVGLFTAIFITLATIVVAKDLIERRQGGNQNRSSEAQLK